MVGDTGVREINSGPLSLRPWQFSLKRGHLYKQCLRKRGGMGRPGSSISCGRISSAKTEERLCLAYLLSNRKATEDRTSSMLGMVFLRVWSQRSFFTHMSCLIVSIMAKSQVEQTLLGIVSPLSLQDRLFALNHNQCLKKSLSETLHRDWKPSLLLSCS